jgi:hypothetical protein
VTGNVVARREGSFSVAIHRRPSRAHHAGCVDESLITLANESCLLTIASRRLTSAVDWLSTASCPLVAAARKRTATSCPLSIAIERLSDSSDPRSMATDSVIDASVSLTITIATLTIGFVPLSIAVDWRPKVIGALA